MTLEKLNTIKEYIKDELNIHSNFEIIFKENIYPSISICPPKITVAIVHGEDWNIIYQLSHEMMHLCFAENMNFFIGSQQFIWVEEIVCEAYSIYSLKKHAQDEMKKWFGYLYDDFYIRMGIAHEIEIENIKTLNTKLNGYKDYNIRQYIHPLSLEILRIIEHDKKAFSGFWDYSIFFNDIENHDNNKIAVLIKDFLRKNHLI